MPCRLGRSAQVFLRHSAAAVLASLLSASMDPKVIAASLCLARRAGRPRGSSDARWLAGCSAELNNGSLLGQGPPNAAAAAAALRRRACAAGRCADRVLTNQLRDGPRGSRPDDRSARASALTLLLLLLLLLLLRPQDKGAAARKAAEAGPRPGGMTIMQRARAQAQVRRCCRAPSSPQPAPAALHARKLAHACSARTPTKPQPCSPSPLHTPSRLPSQPRLPTHVPTLRHFTVVAALSVHAWPTLATPS